jgi:hypothetical protein
MVQLRAFQVSAKAMEYIDQLLRKKLSHENTDSYAVQITNHVVVYTRTLEMTYLRINTKRKCQIW